MTLVLPSLWQPLQTYANTDFSFILSDMNSTFKKLFAEELGATGEIKYDEKNYISLLTIKMTYVPLTVTQLLTILKCHLKNPKIQKMTAKAGWSKIPLLPPSFHYMATVYMQTYLAALEIITNEQ